MGKEILKQLANMIKESETEAKRINVMQEEINQMEPRIREVTDVVTRGKRGKKALGTCTIHGRGFKEYKKVYKKRAEIRIRKAKKEMHLAKIELMVIDAEEYIYTVDDSELRNILMYFCIDRKSWEEVAEAMGEGYTAEACKQKFSRFMRAK